MKLIFISSPQKEFASIRRDLCYFIRTDEYFKKYFDVFLFENLPANRQDPENNYLNKVRTCTIYLGLFGKTYGTLGNDGISATEREYNYATELGKDRLIFIKRLPRGARRARKMEDLVARVSAEVTYKNFSTKHELLLEVTRSLMYWQDQQSKRRFFRR